MFDSITLMLNGVDGSRTYERLDSVTESCSHQTGEVRHSGRLRNLRVRAYYDHVRIEGSLPKYLFGNNLHTLTRAAAEEAVISLSDELGLPIGQAQVTRMEFGSNMILGSAPDSYFSHLGNAPRLERWEIHRNGGHGLVYGNRWRELSFYDKAAEMGRDRQSLPDSLRSSHILRYEIRYTSRPARQFKRKTLEAGTLYDPTFYGEMVGRWQQEYFAIERNRKLEIGDGISLKKTREVLRALAAIGVTTLGGTAGTMAMFASASRKQGLERWQLQRNRDLVRTLGNVEGLMVESELLNELDAAIREIAATQLDDASGGIPLAIPTGSICLP